MIEESVICQGPQYTYRGKSEDVYRIIAYEMLAFECFSFTEN